MPSVRLAIAVVLAAALTPLAWPEEINLYTGRHYDTDTQLYDGFEKKTGIHVNFIEGKSEELLARLEAEGDASPADVYMTADAGNLYRAAEKGLLQPVDSQTLQQRIPAAYRDPGNQWFGFSRRARIIMVAKDGVDPGLVQNYEDLTRPELKGKLCMRSGTAPYNLSLMGAFIEEWGPDKAQDWAKGVVANFSKPPSGGDIDEIKSVAAGECAATLANTYYLVRLMKSPNPDDKAAAAKIKAIFPDQSGRGAHVNISGAGVTKNAPNKDGAIKLLEYLASDEAQAYFALGNNEYPVSGGSTNNAELDSLGQFKADDVNVSAYGKNMTKAQDIMDKAGWK